MVRVNLVFWASFFVAKVAVGQQCSGDVATNYTTCIFNNLATCVGCNTSTTSLSTLTGGITPTCSSLTNDACPKIKCCRACEAATYDLFQNCLVDSFSSIIGTCNLNCSAFPYGNVNNTEPCLTELGSYSACLIQGGQNCTGCNAANSTFSSITGLGSCDAVGNYFCDQISCCEGCQDQARAFYNCAFTSSQNPFNCTSLGNCTAASSAPIAPSSVTTPAPSTASPITPAPSSAGATTAPSASPTTSSPTPASAPVAPTSQPPTSSSSSACSNETNTLTHCFESHVFSCTSCIPVVLNLTSDNTAPQSCQAASNLACPLYNCCPSCKSEVQALFNCKIGGESSLSSCIFNCGGSNSTNTTSAAISITKWGISVMVTSMVAVFTSAAIH